MKRLLTVFTISFLAGCGASTPEVTTPVDDTPVYPSIAGTWSDNDALVTECDFPSYEESLTFTFEQSNKDLSGTIKWYSEYGTPFSDQLTGQINEAGRVTATLPNTFESPALLELRLSEDKTTLQGELILTDVSDCSTLERSKATMTLERE